MEAIIDLDHDAIDDELLDVKMSSLNHSELQSHLSFLLRAAYRHEYSIYTELDFDFASGKTRPDLCIFPKRRVNWMHDKIVMTDVPLTTIEILSPEQGMDGLVDRIYKKHFPAGVQTVWLVVPTLQLITVLLPDETSFNVTSGTLTDPVTGLQLTLSEVFTG
jgi:Uma2 family endonuclease